MAPNVARPYAGTAGSTTSTPDTLAEADQFAATMLLARGKTPETVELLVSSRPQIAAAMKEQLR